MKFYERISKVKRRCETNSLQGTWTHSISQAVKLAEKKLSTWNRRTWAPMQEKASGSGHLGGNNSSNRNGQHLIDFMIENRLTCLNTNFQKRDGKLWTHTYANKSKAQIDYLFINRKWKNSAMNCEAYSTFEGVSSDHRIVTAKIRLSLRKNATRTGSYLTTETLETNMH